MIIDDRLFEIAALGFASLAMTGAGSIGPGEIRFAISRGKSVVLRYNSILGVIIP